MLEIPASNAAMSNLDHFKGIVAEYKVTFRFRTSKKNPVRALPHDVHTDVNRQRTIDARAQMPIDNINNQRTPLLWKV